MRQNSPQEGQQLSQQAGQQKKPKKILKPPTKLNIPTRKFIPKETFDIDAKSLNDPSTEDSYTKQSPLVISTKTGPQNAFFEKYEVREKIGEGASGIVYKCVRKDRGAVYAVKQTRCEDQNFIIMKNAYDTIKMLSHPSIIKYKSMYITGNFRQAYLVMEWFDYPNLTKIKFKSEEELQNAFYKILDAIAYMHEIGLCHRDIKPENILYNQNSGEIKIIDFGVSRQTKAGRLKQQMLTCTGTLYYKAPQLFRNGFYDELIDEWAAGVTLYRLITGVTPFQSEYVQQTIENIERGEVSFREEIWNEYSILVKDLIRSLLSPRQTRINAKSAKNNLWFCGHKQYHQSMHRQIQKESLTIEQSVQFVKNKKNSQQVNKNAMIRNLKNTDLIINKNGICHQSDYQVSDEDEKKQKEGEKQEKQEKQEKKQQQ